VLSNPNSTCEWTCNDTNVTYIGNYNINDTVVALCNGYGTYQFVLTETNGSCVNTDTVIINYQPLYLNAGNDTVICDSIFEMNADTTYQGYWTYNDSRVYILDHNSPNAIIGYIPDTTTWSQSGTFSTVFYWNVFVEECQYTDTVIITFSQCLNNINTLNKSNITRIYPNPAHNNIQIEIEGSQYADKVKILNIDGKLVKQVSIDENIINISDLENGVYFIKIGNSIKKFIKE